MKIGNLEVYGVIYKITNKLNGKVYIGQTTNKKGVRGRYGISAKSNLVEGIYKYHLYIKNGRKRNYNKHLFCSIEKYGFNNFEVAEIFDFAFSKRELDIKENMYITIYNSINNGYNNKEGGSNGKNSDEAIQKTIEKQIEKGQTRHIYQMTIPDLNVIKEFPSIAGATKSLGLTRSAIKNVLNPNCSSLTAGGYAWRYVEKENPKYLEVNFKESDYLRGDTMKMKILDTYNKDNNITISELATMYGTKKDVVMKYLVNEGMIKRAYKAVDRMNNAREKRGEVLALYLKCESLKNIREYTGYSKSIVEKTIEKYNKGLINEEGYYISFQ